MSSAIGKSDCTPDLANDRPQFSLAAHFWVMTGLSILFAVMNAIGPIGSTILLLFLALAIAHVVGNSLGTRLRNEADRQALAEKPEDRMLVASRTARFVPEPARRMHERTGLTRAMAATAAVGAVIGGVLGGVSLSALNWERITSSGMALATISSAVLGGFAGFLASSFFSIASRALREASDG